MKKTRSAAAEEEGARVQRPRLLLPVDWNLPNEIWQNEIFGRHLKNRLPTIWAVAQCSKLFLELAMGSLCNLRVSVKSGAIRLRHCTNLQSLQITHSHRIDETLFDVHKSLRSLVCYGDDPMTINGIASLTSLTALDIRDLRCDVPFGIDMIVCSLTTLTSLTWTKHHKLSYETVNNLTRLTTLKLASDFEVPLGDSDHYLCLPSLTHLDLGVECENFARESFQFLAALKTLKWSATSALSDGINDTDVRLLTNLTNLDLRGNRGITDVGLRALTRLEQLTTGVSPFLPTTIASLERLRTLSYYSPSDPLSDATVHLFHRITNLTLFHFDGLFSPWGLARLTQLTSLTLYETRGIFRQTFPTSFACLVHLTELVLIRHLDPAYREIASLPALTTLRLDWCDGVGNDGLVPLTRLTRLSVADCDEITCAGLAVLTSLTTLHVGKGYDKLSQRDIAPLTNLVELTMGRRGRVEFDQLPL